MVRGKYRSKCKGYCPERVKGLFALGLSFAAVARILNCSKTTIQRLTAESEYLHAAFIEGKAIRATTLEGI